MRKVIASPFVTLDGFMAGPQGEIEWNEPYFDEEMANYVGEQYNAIDTIFFGRVTYQLFAQYWPTQGVKDDPVFAKKMNTLPKVVFSRTLDKVEWNNSRLVKDHVPEEIQALKQQSGRDIVIDGSAGLIHSLTNLGLIDEYRLRVASFFLVHTEPGSGPSLHTHPCEEVFIVQEGEVTFVVGTETLTVNGGNVVIVPPQTPHKFTNSGTTPLRQLSILPTKEIITTWLEE